MQFRFTASHFLMSNMTTCTSSRRRPKTLLLLSLLGLATPFQASSGSPVSPGKFGGGGGTSTGGPSTSTADSTDFQLSLATTPIGANVGLGHQQPREQRRRGLFAKDPVSTMAAASSPHRYKRAGSTGVVGRTTRTSMRTAAAAAAAGRTRQGVIVRKDNGLVLQSTATGLVAPLLHEDDPTVRLLSVSNLRAGARQQQQQAQELTRRLGKITASSALLLIAVELIGRLAGVTAGGATFLAPPLLSPVIDRSAPILSLVLGPLFTVSLWSDLAPFASIALKLSPMPTIQKVRKEGTTGGLPLLPYSAMATMTFVLVCYGLLIQDKKIIMTHGAGHLISLFYCLSFCENVDKEASNLPGTVGMHARTGLGIAAATIATIVMLGQQAAPIVGMTTVLLSCIMYTGPLAALRAAIESKSARNIPLPYAVASTVNALAWFVYGFFRINDFMVWAPCAIGVASATAQIVVNALYGNGPDASVAKKD